MPVSVREFNEFNQEDQSARFLNTNLHIHTPATNWDWDGWESQTRKASEITVKQFFDELNKTSLDLVAITDHNCIDWCGELIKLAQKERKEGKSKLFILPGVEITTYEGPHIIAIFNENKNPEEIRLLLTRLGMSGRGEQEDKVGRHGDPKTIEKVIDEITEEDGTIIGPHVDSKHGLWGFSDFRSRNDVLNNENLKILAALSGNIKRVKEPSGTVRLLYKTMDTNVIKNSFGFINVSDCHRIEDFENNTTWIKMGRPSLEGVRQIIYEPELRVSHEIKISSKEVENPEAIYFKEPNEISHRQIIGISVSGGMLDGLKVKFSPNLNSIIGKNYAGKSALLDCIRFALNTLPLEQGAHDTFCSRVKAFIGDGGEVRIYLKKDGKTYAISRIFMSSVVGRGINAKSTIIGKPDVYLLWEDVEFKPESDLKAEKVFPVEVYPQGEVVRIKDNVSQQMKIVDSLCQVEKDLQDLTEEELGGRKTLLGELKGNREKIINNIQKREILEEATSGIEDLESEIKGLEELSNSEKYKEKKLWSEQEVKIDKYKNELVRLSEKWQSDELLPYANTEEGKTAIETAKKSIPEAEEFKEESALPSQYANRALNIFNTTTIDVSEGVGSIFDKLKEAIEKLTKLEASRSKREVTLDEEIRKSLGPDEIGTKGDVLIRHITDKRKTLTGLQEKVRELEQTEREIERLKNERGKMLKKFKETQEAVRVERNKVVEEIEKGSASFIKVEIIKDCESKRYRERIEEIIDRYTSPTNKISRKEAQLNLIAENILPDELIKIIKDNNKEELFNICEGVTDNTARILLSIGEGDLLEIEECLLDDRFVISYQKEGEKRYTPVGAELSGGEQALALISIAMVPKPVPLIIDQPEDELGPALITHELVEQIRAVKSGRQLLFVTHVPNIPILADSEQVISIKQTIENENKSSQSECCGSLDNIDIVTHLLELDGGDIAFEKRRQRYSRIIESQS